MGVHKLDMSLNRQHESKHTQQQVEWLGGENDGKCVESHERARESSVVGASKRNYRVVKQYCRDYLIQVHFVSLMCRVCLISIVNIITELYTTVISFSLL